MATAGLAITNVVIGLAGIGAGVGFSIADKDKIDELDTKSKKLKDDVLDAGNLYNHIYYLVVVNLDRVKKAVDKLPSDMLAKVQKQITSDISDDKAEKAIKIMGEVMGYTGDALGITFGLLLLVDKLRKRKAKGEEPTEKPEDPFEYVPLDDEIPPVVTESESSFTETPMLTKFMNGVNIAGIVFGIAGLATTIGLGIWTLEKLNKAIDDVEKKQTQVNKFQTAMKAALDELVVAAGLPAKEYSALSTMAATWRTISENFDSYQKSLYYAIKGYHLNKTLEQIKVKVAGESDSGMPFPEDGYPLAKTLADDINYKFEQKKTDKEIVAFFATDDPNVGLRFVFEEYFISTLRPY